MAISYKLSDDSKEILNEVRSIVLRHGVTFFPGIAEAVQKNDGSLSNNVLLEGCLREFPLYLKHTAENRMSELIHHYRAVADAPQAKRPRYPGYVRDIVTAIERNLWDRSGLRQERDCLSRTAKKALTTELLAMVSAGHRGQLSELATKIVAWIKSSFEEASSIDEIVWGEIGSSLILDIEFPYRGWIVLDRSSRQPLRATEDRPGEGKDILPLPIRSRINIASLDRLARSGSDLAEFWRSTWA